MDTKHWISLNRILDQALELPMEERISFISNYDGLSDEMRKDAISFLKSIHKSDTLWDDLIESSSELIDHININDIEADRFDEANPPDQVGPYKILEKLASGGMGNVYLAERSDGHLQITVALKIIRRECTDSHHIHQFNIERNVLGRLNHPNIARIYDGGITKNGRPYLVMEYVKGSAITNYCRSQNCSVDRKLNLMEQICDGVNFAHSNLVVHRDLKPDNIFVDSYGNCKILDFGIAKIIDPEDISAGSDTNPGDLKPFSIRHAAPEQLKGGLITTATDVYALGLLLYELLTGSLPFDLKEKTPREAIQIIFHSPPPIASSRTKDNSTAAQLRCDLDDIIQKALQTDPAERYQSAGDLLNDIRNYRENRPLSFKTNRRFYKLKKFTVRNSGVLSGAAVIILILFGLSFYYISTIQAERQKAMAEEQQASFIAGFMVDLFDASDPLSNINDTLTVYDILQSGREKLDNWEGSDLSKADILISLGSAYKKLGDFEQSQTLLEDAYKSYWAISEDSLASSMLKPTLELANLYRAERNFNYSAQYFDRALQIIELQRISDPETITSLYSSYANTLSELGNPQLAIIYLEEALAQIKKANLSDNLLKTVQTNLAQAYRRNHDYQQSETLYKELLLNLPADNPYNLESSIIHNNLGYLLKVQGRFDEASRHYRSSLDINRYIYGLKHPNTTIVMNNLAALHLTAGRFDDAEKMRLELLDINREDFGDNHWRTGSSYESLGILHIRSGELEEASAFFERSHEIYTRALGEDHIWTERTMLYLSLCRFNSEEAELAKNEFRQALRSLKEKRLSFSRYDVQLINNLVNNFESYPSITATDLFSLLYDID